MKWNEANDQWASNVTTSHISAKNSLLNFFSASFDNDNACKNLSLSDNTSCCLRTFIEWKYILLIMWRLPTLTK